MSLAPRSLTHAIHAQFDTPRLRNSRTPAGERALVFETPRAPVRPQAPAIAPEPAPALTPELETAPRPATQMPTGGRFMDDQAEVGFRSGLLRSTRDAYDLFVVSPDREEAISRFGPVERVRVDEGGAELPAIRLTPQVRQRVNAGDVTNRTPAPRRLMFGVADGQPDSGATVRTNADGFQYVMPYADNWGDTRFNPEDRARAMDVLKEIGGRGPDFWKEAPWADVVRAVDDVAEITANLFFYAPDHQERVASAGRLYASAGTETPDERGKRWYYSGEVRDYVRWREGYGNDSAAESILVPTDVRVNDNDPMARLVGPGRQLRKKKIDDLEDIGAAARDAIEAIYRSRRRGVKELLQWDERDEPRGPKPITAPVWDKAGRYSAVRRAVETLGDEWFADEDGKGGRPLSQILSAVRKARNVTAEEVEQLDLNANTRDQHFRVTREWLLAAIDDRSLQMQMLKNEFDPARPTRNYELGGTRAFDGPRVPGYGKYFERRFQWPDNLGRGGKGEKVAAADISSAHWETGVWGSIRGSVREVPKFGKGVLGEEMQRDPYQKVASGAAREVGGDDWVRLNREMMEVSNLRDTLATTIRNLNMDTLKHRDTAGPEARMAWDEALRAGEILSVEKWRHIGETVERFPQLFNAELDYARTRINDAVGYLERVSPEALAASQSRSTKIFPKMPLSDSQSTRFLVRDLFLKNADEGGEWVAIPTGTLNDRIQHNTFQSAAHYYDGTLQNVLGKVARDIDPSLKVERVILPAPPLKRGVPVYMVKGITPAINDRLRNEGMPRYGMAARVEGEPPMTSARFRDQVEAGLRTDPKWGATVGALLDSGELNLIGNVADLPDSLLNAGQEIPAWVGAVHDSATGKTYFMTDVVPDFQLRGLMVHEVGVHYGLPKMLGARRFKTFLTQVRSLVEREEVRFAAMVEKGEADASDRQFHPVLGPYDKVREHYGPLYMGAGESPRSKPSELTSGELEEVAAHIAENLEMAFEQNPKMDTETLRAGRTWWENLKADVKRWAATMFGVGDLSPRDVHLLAVGALRRAGRQAAREATAHMVTVPESRVLMFAKSKGYEGEDPREAADWLDAQGYFSPALDAARRYPQPSGARDQMVNWLQNQPGVKKDELNTLFLDEFAALEGKATREEFAEWVRAHRFATRVTFQSKALAAAGEGASSEWGQYTYLEGTHTWPDGARSKDTPRGYFEAIIDAANRFNKTGEDGRQFDMPGEHWRGGHFGGGLMHVRGAHDQVVGGKPATLLIEIQSDMFDAKPADFADVSAVVAQRRKDEAAIERDHGPEGLYLWERVRQNFQSAYLLSALSEGPSDVVAIALPPRPRGWGEDGPDADALYGLVREFNAKAEQIASDRITENGGPFEFDVGADPRRALVGSSYAVTKRDTRAPYRNTWPEKAFADLVRESIRRGDTRIAWSTGDAIRTISGMTGYAGDLYDTRIPRLVKKWLGVDVQRAPIEGTKKRAPVMLDDAEPSEEAMQAVDLAINETAPDALVALPSQGPESTDRDMAVIETMGEFLQEQALEHNFFSRVLMGRRDISFARSAVKRALEAEIADGRFDAPFSGSGGVTPIVREHLLSWGSNFVDRTVAELRRMGDANHDKPTEAYYFDVTPEVRALALSPRSLFFGRAERIAPGFVDEQGRSVFGSRTQSLDDAVAGGGTQDYRTRGVKKSDANTAVGAVAANVAGAVGAGVSSAVMANQQERDERLAEYQRLQAEAEETAERTARSEALRAERAERQRAVDARDLEALPDMPRETMEERAAWLNEAVQWANSWTGVDPAYLRALIARETAYTLQPDIRPVVDGVELSAAQGLGQFIPRTWAGEMRRVGGDYGIDVAGMSVKELTGDAAIQDLRNDPRLAVAMTAEHQMENVRWMEERLNRPVTAAEAYAAHFLGRDGAVRFIDGVEEGWTAEQFERAFRSAVKSNPFLEGLSAAQVMSQFREEFPGMPYRVRPAEWEAFDSGGDSP